MVPLETKRESRGDTSECKQVLREQINISIRRRWEVRAFCRSVVLHYYYYLSRKTSFKSNIQEPILQIFYYLSKGKNNHVYPYSSFASSTQLSNVASSPWSACVESLPLYYEGTDKWIVLNNLSRPGDCGQKCLK